MPEEVVQAKRFEVVDDAGAVRARFGLESDGGVHLELYDAEAHGGMRHIVRIGVQEAGARIGINVGGDGVGLAASRDGEVWGVAVTALDDAVGCTLSAGSDGFLSIRVRDDRESTRFRFEIENSSRGAGGTRGEEG